MTSLEDSERMAKTCRTVVVPPSSDEMNRLAKSGEKTMDSEEVMAPFFEAASGKEDSYNESVREL